MTQPLDIADNAPKLPKALERYLDGYTCSQNQIGRSSAGVYRYQRGTDSLYLKLDKAGSELRREYEVLRWLSGKLPVPDIIHWREQDGLCCLLMTELPGHMTCADETFAEPYDGIVRLLAEALLMLQAVDISSCPFDNMLEKKLGDALYCIENDQIDIAGFLEGNTFASLMDLYHHLCAAKPPEELCFTHGDFCLPNIFMGDDRVTGFIDMGRSGIADKWQDIALCVRSLGYNLGNQKDKERCIMLLFDYLNIKPDWDKINYYILLDELF
jgi:aminoglycoside 3'-phosphotransferase III